MNLECGQDLWEYLGESNKKIVLYGMGNGADKILDVCRERGMVVSGIFASDGFARGNRFHGMEVLTWGKIKERFGAENVIVLLAFGTSRSEVLENISRIAAEAELYAPDVPAFGEGVFDRAFFEAHRAELKTVWELLSDEESRRIFACVVQYKLTGRIEYLMQAESDPRRVMEELVCPNALCSVADLGAYNGDTARALLDFEGSTVRRIYAMEPDPRNFRKLLSYAEGEERAKVIPYQAGAWCERATLSFDGSGNRNASFESNRSSVLSSHPVKEKRIEAETLDNFLAGAKVEHIKYDVEGSEREALLGSANTIQSYRPSLLVSLYHRNEDLFSLPLLIKEKFPFYRSFYLRRFRGVPAWDLNLYVME